MRDCEKWQAEQQQQQQQYGRFEPLIKKNLIIQTYTFIINQLNHRDKSHLLIAQNR